MVAQFLVETYTVDGKVNEILTLPGNAVPVRSSILILFVSLLKLEQNRLVFEHNEPLIDAILDILVTTTGVELNVQSLIGILTII